MKLSSMGISKNKITDINEQFPIQDLLGKTGQLTQFSSGIYAYDHIPFLLKKKIKDIISEVLTRHNCVEISLPVMQPESIWIESGRLQRYIDEDVMFRVLTDKTNYCIAPTAEEAVVEFATKRLPSYKNLPVTFFQIGDKFRNELRPRGYLLRGKSFEMMDAYSFNKTVEELENTYNDLREAYLEIFEELGLKVLPVLADSGSIGGSKSEEFMILSDLGEDKIYLDEETNRAFNNEILDTENGEEYLKEEFGIVDKTKLKEKRSLELGHIFNLGTKYSKSMNRTFVNKDGKNEYYNMGCYGIGVSRVLAAIYEESILKNEKGEVEGFALPIKLSPYKVQIVTNENNFSVAETLYKDLKQENINVLFDDRLDISLGSKIKDVKYLGTPYMIVIGNNYQDGLYEIENIKTKEKMMLTKQEIIKIIKDNL